MDSLDIKSICKSDNEFSFLSTMYSLVGNENFKPNWYSIVSSNNELTTILEPNLNTSIWHALSAIGEEIGGIFQANINNFIDNLINIDTCTVHGLQSLAQIIGTNYSVFSSIDDFPQEIVKIIDVLSIKKEYLVNSNFVNSKLAKDIFSECSVYYEQIEDTELSIAPNICADLLTQLQENTFNSFLTQQINATYNDLSATKIYEALSSNILLSNFVLVNPYQYDIEKLRTQYDIPKTFNVAVEVDNIENGLSQYNNYSAYLKKLLDFEIRYRHDAFNPLELSTRNKYYKELKTKEYFTFIENLYAELANLYLTTSEYDIDNKYFVISANLDNTNRLLKSDVTIDNNKIELVAKQLSYITNAVREVREQLKFFCQKNFMKGTFLLISYVINEYLKNNTIDSINKLNPEKTLKFDSSSNKVSLVEYIDPVNYFNIDAVGTNAVTITSVDLYDASTISDDTSTIEGTTEEINERYWEIPSTVDAIGAMDSTNIFEKPPTIQSNSFAFNIAMLSAFYLNMLNTDLTNYQLKIEKNQYQDKMVEFLESIFDLGADKTTKAIDVSLSNDNALNYYIDDIALSSYKKDLYYRYTANKDGELPFYYYSNTVHPSYQIHPYLSTFMEMADYQFAIKNIANLTYDETILLITTNLSNYIDLSGYLINLWNNPLICNQDYVTRYEQYNHYDEVNELNPVYGYDGLFYPKAVVQLSTNTENFINAISSNAKTINNGELNEPNYYYGLVLRLDEYANIVDKLTGLSSLICDAAYCKGIFENGTTITKYGLDIYQNAYIIVDDNNGNKTLWIKNRNQAIAFPAIVFDSNGYNENLSPLYFNSADTSINNAFINTNLKKVNLTTDLSTLVITDFYISIDRLDILINVLDTNGNTKTLVATISKKYNTLKKYDVLTLENVDTDYLFDNNNYKFGTFLTLDNKIGAVYYHCSDNKNLNLTLAVYDYDNTNDSVIRIYPTQHVELNYSVKNNDTNNTDIVFDFTKDTLIATYITDDINISDLQNAIGNKNIDGTNLRYNLTESLVTLTFNIGINSGIMQIDVNNDTSKYRKSMIFKPYTDIGFFGLLSGDNDLVNTKMLSILDFRLILKFQLICQPKDKTIDFKQCLPIRLHDGYITDKDGRTTYNYVHFTDALSVSSLDKNKDYYSSTEVLNILCSDTGIMVDEEYIYTVANNSMAEFYNRLGKKMPGNIYLYTGEVSASYKYPGMRSYIDSSITADNIPEKTCVLKIIDQDAPLSVSWHKDNTDKILLDFNTEFFNNAINSETNYYNEKRSFLHLDYAEAGLLNTYVIDNGKLEQLATYYIKNVSDEFPKFILSAHSYTITKNVLAADSEHILCMSDNGNNIAILI